MIYIALLRGINVSGHKKIRMAELREVLEGEGFTAVKTYIQSGNVFVQSEGTHDEVAKAIHQSILKHFGFDVPVLVKTREELQTILEANPLDATIIPQSYYTLLNAVPEAGRVEALMAEDYPNEIYAITDTCVYSYCSMGAAKAKCSTNLFERKLKVTATARNYKTMIKLVAMSAEMEKDQ